MFMERDYVRYLHELTEFNVFYSRMQNVRASLRQIEDSMSKELFACKQIRNSKFALSADTAKRNRSSA